MGFEILDWIYNLLKIRVCLSIEAKFLRVMAVAMKIGFEEMFAEVIAALPDTFKKGENKAHLKRLGSGLNRLLRLFNDDTKRLDLPKKNTKRSTEDVKKGEKQVHKCSKSRWWSSCFRVCCPIELCESDEDIARSCEDDTEANSTRNHGTEISLNLNITLEKEDSNLDKKRVFCAVRRPPDFTVGFDTPMKELKTLLLKEEVHQLLLTAPAGCGKTTLVQMLCQDKQIKGTPLLSLCVFRA